MNDWQRDVHTRRTLEIVAQDTARVRLAATVIYDQLCTEESDDYDCDEKEKEIESGVEEKNDHRAIATVSCKSKSALKQHPDKRRIRTALMGWKDYGRGWKGDDNWRTRDWKTGNWDDEEWIENKKRRSDWLDDETGEQDRKGDQPWKRKCGYTYECGATRIK